MEQEEKRKEQLQTVLDGNAFYEIDLKCVKRKQEEKKKNMQKRQRS